MIGNILLNANGVQDTFITGNPEQSHFVSVYKKHTPFFRKFYAIESEVPVESGSLLSFRIPVDRGDFITKMCLKGNFYTNTSIDWRSFITNNLIEYVELFIGEQSIHKLTGEYISIYQQSHAIDVSTYEFLNAHGSNKSNVLFRRSSSAERNPFFLDIPFFFHDIPELAIPCCALRKHVIRVTIKLRPKFVYGIVRLFETCMNVTYANVGINERNYTESLPIFQNINQLQISEFVMPIGVTTKSVMLNFSNPISELYFVAQPKISIDDNERRDYVNIEHIRLKFNNTVVFDRNNNFLSYKQALDNHNTTPSGDTLSGGAKYCSYSFALHPMANTPTGSVNMSRIIHKELTVTIPSSNDAHIIRVYAVSHNVMVYSGGLAGLKF